MKKNNPSSHLIHIQADCALPAEIHADNIRTWVNLVLESEQQKPSEVSVSIVSPEVSCQLNHQYRDKNHATNVLSFPLTVPAAIAEMTQSQPLGDIVICPQVLAQEAEQHQKKLSDHWAHIVIHGTLHLLGYDHILPQDASVMEGKEIQLLNQVNIPNPYGVYQYSNE